MLEVGAIDIMAMLDLVDDGGELAGHLAVQSLPEDLGDIVGCEPPQPQLTASLEELVDGEVTFEDEVAAIFDLRDRLKAREIDAFALLDGELRPQDQGPIIKPLAGWRGSICLQPPAGRRHRQQQGRRCRSCESRFGLD